jgi:mercuric ion binding protein
LPKALFIVFKCININFIIMKSTGFIIVVLFLVLPIRCTVAQTHAQTQMATSKTETIKVSGNCELCKARIEKAAKVDGVSKAEWNQNTKLLTLVYNPKIVTNDAVQKKIASVGHDTEKYRADDKAYNSLPGCCKYR